MGFVGNYAPCGLSPQIDGMPVIHVNDRLAAVSKGEMNHAHWILFRHEGTHENIEFVG